VLSAAILIGGQARRLDGRVKPLLPVGGRSILARQIDTLGAAGIQHIALVGRWTVEDRPPAPVVADAVMGGGALGGLYTALLVATTDPVLVLAGDMPFISVALLHRLGSIDPDADAVLPRTEDGQHPLCGVYRRRLALRVKARLDRGALGVRDALVDCVVRELGPAEISALDPDGTMLMNVNTLADYHRACDTARASA
jgi:molybdopterin-guanine dinucleotide biosynthesis protein A